MSKLIGSLEKFFFGQTDLFPVALFRLVFAIIMILMYTMRFFEIPLMFFDSGLMPFELASQFMPDFVKPPIYWFPTSDSMVVTYMCVHMGLLLLLTLGILGQFTTWIVLFFHLALLQRNYTLMYGADLISTFFLFYLGFIQHNKYFSVLKYFRGRVITGIRSDLSSLGVRFIQIQLIVTYTYTGLEKLKGISWWEGTAVWKVIGNSLMVPFDLTFMSHFPFLIAAATYLTVLFEIYFGFAIFVPWLRKPWLILGGTFHLLAAVTMGLIFFSGVMVSSYIVFFTSTELKNLGRDRKTFIKTLFQ